MIRLCFAVLLCAGCTANVSNTTSPDTRFRIPAVDRGTAVALDQGVDGSPVIRPDAGRLRDGGAPHDGSPIPQQADGDVAEERNPYLPRMANATCRLPEPPPVGQYTVERAFPQLNFARPLWLGTAPGDPDTIFVMEQRGRILAFDDRQDVQSVERFLTISASRAGNEEGLLGLAFHPEYAENGRFFVYYSAQAAECRRLNPASPNALRCSVISEYRRVERRRADPEAVRVIMTIDQPYGNHNGGDLQFGPDGLLYISVGDGGAANDPHGHGQNTQTLLGNILRVDVDTDEDLAYSIPSDNPFVRGGGRPEIYAWGLRNVWRMRFDPSTGLLWAADVGQNRREEINRITGPGNFGWKIREGFGCFGAQNCQSEGLIPPVHEYNRAAGESVTGGLVYRGTRRPELWGQYLFADFDTRAVWALPADGEAPIESQLLARQTQVSSFGEDANGNVYMTTFQADRPIARLRPTQPVEPERPFPELLSQSGCFSDTAQYELAPGVIDYQVNHPFWSDGLEKRRHVAFPDGTRAVYRAQGGFEMPVGTVLIKTFLEPESSGDATRRIETRMYARFEQGWRGFSWRWNDEQTDAELVDGRVPVPFEIEGEQATWMIPSRTDCDRCHTAAAGHTLGWSARQLSGRFSFEDGSYDQLASLKAAGYLDMADDVVAPAHPRPGAPASAEARARAYLHVNCAPCHQPGGGANSSMDLRSFTPLSNARLCGEQPQQGHLNLENGRLLDPGHPERSVLLERMNRRDEAGMPSLGSTRVDQSGTAVVREWIDTMDSCP